MSDETQTPEGAADANVPAQGVNLADLSQQDAPPPALSGDDNMPTAQGDEGEEIHTGQELESLYDVPVNVQAVLGKSKVEVNQLLKLAPGAVIELDRKVGEAIDIYVNDRLVARGEVVMVEEHLGVTMTEIIKAPRA